MVWQALILYKIAWNFNMLLVITISNSLGKIIQFEPSLYIKPLVAIAYFVIPTLSGVICCGGKQRKLARKNFALYLDSVHKNSFFNLQSFSLDIDLFR